MSNHSHESLLTEVDALLSRAATLSDPAARDLLSSTVRALMELHGAALARIAEKTNPAQLATLADDETIGGLLLLYDLHPHDFPTRVNAALESVRPALASHGGSVELLDASVDGDVRLKFVCRGCKSTAATLRQSVENAIYQKAPDTAAIQFDEPAAESGGFVPVEALINSTRRRAIETAEFVNEGAIS